MELLQIQNLLVIYTITLVGWKIKRLKLFIMVYKLIAN